MLRPGSAPAFSQAEKGPPDHIKGRRIMLVVSPGARKLLGTLREGCSSLTDLRRDRDAAADEACGDISTSLTRTTYQASNFPPVRILNTCWLVILWLGHNIPGTEVFCVLLGLHTAILLT